MDIFDVIAARASVRRLEPVDIPDGDLDRILDAGRRAPSGLNVQPLEYIVVREPETIRRFARVQEFIGRASCIIAIAADPTASTYWLEDASAAAENMLLAIAALGYGSTWVEGTLLRHEAWAKDALGVPEHLRLVIFLPMGRPAGEARQAGKRPFGEAIHYERFGQQDR